MANNEVGAFLNIPKDVLNRLESFDKNLELIKKHSHTAADALKNGFGSVVVDTKKLEYAITSLANKIDALNTAGKAVGNIGTSMNEVSKNATRAASSLSSVAQTLNRVKPDNGIAKSVEQYRNISSQIEQVSNRQKQLNDIIKSYELTMSRINSGKGGVIYVEQQQQVQSARQELEANKQLLVNLRQKQQEIVNTNKAYQQQVQLAQQLRNFEQERNSLPNQRSKQTLADMRAYYSELEKSSARAAKAAEQAIERESRADEKRYNEWLRRKAQEEKEAIRIANAKSKAEERAISAYRNTPQGALNYSTNAKYLRDQVTAINHLKQARLSLDTTDKNYHTTLQQINQAIAKHTQALQQAGVQSQNLSRNQRNLMDISEQLQRKFALLFSVSQMEGYVKKIASVRGEFELQQRSLQAILQSKTKADEIYGQTLDLALRSPFRAKQLITYTKQLAAYRIESDKLFDTTKRLSDVSAGLGVDMQRLILAYGQVKAAAYLRGSEVRQFTEAGINVYGELQRYFQEVKGEAYTTAQIVDMISKRKVTFEDFEAIFKRITDKGGLFYNMQEIQSQTLAGKIGILNDAFDRMLNDIGKSNEGVLKGSLDVATALVRNWESVVNVAKAFGIVIAAMGLTAWNAKIMETYKGFNLLQVGIKHTGKALSSLGNLFKASLPTMAVLAAIAAVTELISRFNEYRNAIAESANKYYEAKINLSIINDEAETDIKTALNKLVDEMNNQGFEVKIKANLSEKEAKDQFDKYLEDYEVFLNRQRLIEARYAENKSNHWFEDDIEEDSKQYAESVGRFIAAGDKLRPVLMELAQKESSLSKEHRQVLEDLAKGPKKGEDMLSYTERMKDELRKMAPQFDKMYGSIKDNLFLGRWNKARSNFTIASNKYKRDLGNIKEEIEDVFGAKSDWTTKEGKMHLKALIDKSNLDQATKEWAYEHYELNVKVKVEKKEVESVATQVQKNLDGKSFKINLSADTTGIIKALDDTLKGIKESKELIDILSRAEKGIYWGLTVNKEEYNKIMGTTSKQMGWNQKDLKTARLSQEQYVEYLNKKREFEEKQYKKLGGDPNDLIDKKAAKQAAKQERDIWQERIDTLEKMQARYEKLKQYIGDKTAQSETRSAFADSISYTGLNKIINPENIIPTKQGLINALNKVLNSTDFQKTAGVKKINDLKQKIAELEIGIKVEAEQESLERTKLNIEEMFNGLDLHKKLKDSGFSEADIQALFPGISKTLDEVENNINESFNKLRDATGELGKTENKEYEEQIKKLNEKRIKDSQDLAIELTKAYKTQLSDQLQLDRWYYEEKAKIENAKLTDELKEEYNKNLTNQYNKKSDENTWKNFQNSDMYISLFENLESSSTRMLTALRDKLASLRENLKNLPADQLKVIISQQEKVDELIAVRNPFSGLISGAKKYIEFLKQRKELEEENIRANNAVEYYTKQRGEQSKIVQQKKQEYNEAVSVYGANSLQAILLSYQLQVEEEKLDVILNQLVAEGKISQKTAEQIRNGQKLGKTISEKFNKIGSGLSEFSSTLPQIAGDLENVFGTMSAGTKDTIDSISEIAGGLGQTASGIGRIYAGDIFGGALQTVGGLAKTIGAFFAVDDKKKEREIQRQIKSVEKLQEKYEDLKEAIDNAWTLESLHSNTKEVVENIDQQIASYQAMIKAEQDKKKTDQERIDEFNEQIKQLEKTKQEILDQEKKELGGIGGEAEYRTQAEGFVQAWLDAFQETGDGLKGLEENFDDFIKNLFVKQASMRIASKMLEPLFKNIDKYLEDGKWDTEDMNKTLAEAENIFPQLSESLRSFFESMNFSSNKGNAELSALTQSIQGITETTAEELAALLNSVRFFVSQQTTDISAIRALLDARYSLEDEKFDSSSNPMLIELRAQTEYLGIISDRIDRVFATNASSNGPGLRVYMQ